MAALLKKVNRAVFLDRDGVINRALERGGQPYPPTSLAEFEILPEVPAALAKLQAAGQPWVTAQIRIEGDPSQLANYSELRTRLEQLQKNPAKGRNGVYATDNSVVIKAMQGTQWNDVVNAFNAAVGAQYSNVNFASVDDAN